MRIKGNKAFEKKLRQTKKGSIDSEIGQSEMENELFEQSISKSSQGKERFGIVNKGKVEEQGSTQKKGLNKKSSGGKGILLPEDIQEILFNNNQIYVNKPLKEINKLFRDLKEARKIEKMSKQEPKTSVNSGVKDPETPAKKVSTIIDNFAEQMENCFKQLQSQVPPQSNYLSSFKGKIKGFFEELKEATGKQQISINNKKIMGTERSTDCRDAEREIKSLTHILDGSIENLINQEKPHDRECSILQANSGSLKNEVSSKELGKKNQMFVFGGWATGPRLGSLFNKMVVNDRVYHELNNIKKLNFKLKEALSTYKKKKR